MLPCWNETFFILPGGGRGGDVVCAEEVYGDLDASEFARICYIIYPRESLVEIY